VIIAAGIPIVFYLAWLSGNLKNDELKPELATLLAHHPAEIDEQANAYFDVIGMSAPANIEPHAWGAAWLAKARAKDHMLLTEFTPTAPVLNNTTTYSEKLDLPCAKKDIKFNCIELVSHNKSAVESTILAQAERLGRFDAILDKPYQQPYRELTLQSDFPSILPETTVVKLAVTRIALDIAQGHDEVALERWGREPRFILNQANNSYALVDKMVAIANLNRYQNIMADYIEYSNKDRHLLRL